MTYKRLNDREELTHAFGNLGRCFVIAFHFSAGRTTWTGKYTDLDKLHIEALASLWYYSANPLPSLVWKHTFFINALLQTSSNERLGEKNIHELFQQ